MLFDLSQFVNAINWFFASSDAEGANGQQSKKSGLFVKVGATAAAAAAGYFLYRKFHKPAQNKLKEPIRVVITGAAGQIGYSLVPLICSGSVFGFDQPIILHLLDLPSAERPLKGLVMEIEDCAYPLVKSVVATSDPKIGFSGVNVAVLLGGSPRKAGIQRADLMSKNAPIFVQQGKMLEQHADRNVKVLVVANPANTNCLITALNAPSIPRKNFTCLTRLDDNRARGQLAKKLGADVVNVHNTIVWGNHSNTQFPDVEHAYVEAADGTRTSVRQAVDDEKWLSDAFMPAVQNRGAAVIEARGGSSAMSAANASADHLRSWFLGTRPGEWVSMGVYTQGSHGVTSDLIFSLPCECKNGEWTPVESVMPSDAALIASTQRELIEEKEEALRICEELKESSAQ